MHLHLDASSLLGHALDVREGGVLRGTLPLPFWTEDATFDYADHRVRIGHDADGAVVLWLNGVPAAQAVPAQMLLRSFDIEADTGQRFTLARVFPSLGRYRLREGDVDVGAFQRRVRLRLAGDALFSDRVPLPVALLCTWLVAQGWRRQRRGRA